jgi:FkbM family methyltransferase
MPDVRSQVVMSGRTAFDIDLDSDDFNQNFILEILKGGYCYEPEVATVMLHGLRRGDACIDVGANVGFFTLMMSGLVGDEGHVLAFEPGTNNLPKLKHNLDHNRITNVKLIEQPAWHKNARIKFWLDADSSGSNAVWDPGRFFSNVKSRQHPENFEVDAVRADDLVDRPIRMIKIDTEGAEQRILEGLEDTLRRYHPPYVLVELNPFGLAELGCSTESMREYMRQFSYDLFFLDPEGKIPTLVPARTEVTYQNGYVVMNAMFSTVDAVSEAWPKAPYR